MPFSAVQNTHEFLFEHFELPELVKPIFAGLVGGGLELNPLLHEFVNLLVEEGDLDDLAVPGEVFGGAAGTDEDVLFLEAFQTGADLVRLHVVLAAEFASQYLHSFAL